MYKKTLLLPLILAGSMAMAQTASMDEAYEEGYYDGFIAAQVQAEADHQAALESAREAGRQAPLSEPNDSNSQWREGYREGYRDGYQDRGEADAPSNPTPDKGINNPIIPEQPEINDSYEQERVDYFPLAAEESSGREPYAQFSLNYMGHYGRGASRLKSHLLDFNTVVTFIPHFGISISSGFMWVNDRPSIHFYDRSDNFLYTRDIKRMEFGASFAFGFYTRLPINDAFAFALDLGWFYNFNIATSINGLSSQERTAYFESDLHAVSSGSMTGPSLKVGFELGNRKNKVFYVPFGYTLRYNVINRSQGNIWLHGFYIGAGIRI